MRMHHRFMRLLPAFSTTLCVLAFGCLVGLTVSPTIALGQGDNGLLDQGKQQYSQQKYTQALATFRKVLRQLRGKPLYQKVPAYLYIGLCLFKSDRKGLAWKAFEQALYQNTNATLPETKDAEAMAFFTRVRARVIERGGEALGAASDTGAKGAGGGGGGGSSQPSPWPWVAFGIAGVTTAMGIVLIVNASGNQSEVDSWIKSAAAANTPNDQIERTAQPLRDSISTRNTLGIAMLITGGVAAATGVVLLLLLPKRSAPPSTASLSPSPAPPTQRALLLVAQ